MLRYLFNLTESDYNIIVEAEWFLLTNPQEKDVIMDAKTLVTCLNALPAAQAVLIRGDHGVGKSQLVHQLAKSPWPVSSGPDPTASPSACTRAPRWWRQ